MPQSITPAIQSASTSSAQNAEVISSNEGIPEALKLKSDEFDISQFGNFKDPATAVVQAINEGNNQSSMTSSDLKTIEDNAIRTRMNEFANSMQNGNFNIALQQVYDTIRFICRIEPRRSREIVTCANYVLAQKILIRNSALENELTKMMSGTHGVVQKQIECALLSMFLAELKHLLPRHRVAAMRVAVEKNLAVGNFGMCARWLKHLIDKAPAAQKQALL